MAHLTSRGDPCCYPDGHNGQHRHQRTDPRVWNRSQGARDAASRYRNHHPVRRALTIAKHNAKTRLGV